MQRDYYEYNFENEECGARIIAHYNNLSAAEKRIADFFLKSANVGETADLSAQGLAEITGTSGATVVRFCRSLGFKGLAEFKFYLRRRILTPVGSAVKIGSADSSSAIKQKTQEYLKRAIDETALLVDDEELEQAIHCIANAKRLEIYGEGSSGGVALTASIIFLNLGYSCSASSDPYIQVMSASSLTKHDVAIGISNSGNAKNTIDGLMIAKRSGATTICITGRANSPLTEYADVKLVISNKPASSVHDLPIACICQLHIINIIQTAILIRNYNQISGRIKNVRQAVKTKTVFRK